MDFVALWIALLCPEIFLGPHGLKSQISRIIISRMFSNETRKMMSLCKASDGDPKVKRHPYNILDICIISDMATRLVENNACLVKLLNGKIDETSDELIYFTRFIHWVVFGSDVILPDGFFVTKYGDFINSMFSGGHIELDQKNEYLSPVIPYDAISKLTSANPFKDLSIPRSKLSFVLTTVNFKKDGFTCCEIVLNPIYLGNSVSSKISVIREDSILLPGPEKVTLVSSV